MNRDRNRRLLGLTAAAAILTAAVIGLPRRFRSAPSIPRPLVASVRAEPRSFNRYVARDLTTTVITYLTHAALVRVNRTTNQLEPELATSWELLDDHQTYRLHLRPGLRFSDGVPFTPDDVVFSFRAIYDRRTESLLADTLQVRGQPLTIAAEDADTVTIRFPSPFGPGLRVLDGIPIFPRHRLEDALAAGQFQEAWGVQTLPSELAGLGPFRLERYEPGQRLMFTRNPYYWCRDLVGQLPKADRVVLEIVPDQDTEALRLQSGDIDFTQSELRPSDYVALKRAAEAGRVTLANLGIGLDGDLFWVNLKTSDDSRRRWLKSADFRRAVAHSVDRDSFVSTVYFGAAVPGYTLVSPGNRDWYADEPAPGYDISGAKKLLASLKLVDDNGDGMLEDVAHRPVRFTLLTQAGNTSLERGAAVIRQSLARVGVRVDVVTLEVGALIERVMAGNYDAAYFRLLTTDTDPTLNADFWLSSGTAHVWNPAQRRPVTEWEGQTDSLIDKISTTLDQPQRHDLFRQVQRIIAREVPALCFAFPRLSSAMNARVVGATPAAFRPPLLWNPAAIHIDTRAH